MRKALIVILITAVLGVAGLVAMLMSGVLMIGTQPPYIITPGTNPLEMMTPPLYGVAYVYPNGSYILLMWVFNPNQYPIDEGTWGVLEQAPRVGFWGPYGNPIDYVNFQPAPLNGIIPPFSFRTTERWGGMLVNETVYEARL
ncbi:MAG: hypothetical protein ACP5GH_07245, partial [Nitrososphaeria archaeon]